MIIIRKAAKRDYPTILKILDGSTNSKELEGFVPPAEITQKFLTKLKSQLELTENGVLVAEQNLKPMGFVFFIQENDCLEIEEIDVLKEYQKKGVGEALVNEVEKIARDRNIASLKTGTSINAEGTPWKAYGFWTKMGFQDTGERTDSGYGFKYCKLERSL